MSDIDDIRSALSYIDSQDRDTWWQVGAAVKDELGENGYDLWDEWSQRADNYDNRAAKSTWKSLKPGSFSIGTVWKLARQNGWQPAKPYTPPSVEEQARRKAESEARRQAAEQERQQTQQRVKGTAQKIWNSSRPASLSHPYLAAKGITNPDAIAGLRQNKYKDNDNLIIPVLYENEIVNLQSINQNGGKRFLAGGQVQGAYAFIGKADDVEKVGVVMAEGYATAASIYEATGKPVIIAFDAGNMVAVAERLAQKLPQNVPVVIAVDNDASQTGIKKARQAAALLGDRATAIQPEFSMTLIQQYQKGKGVDEKGRPPLPSDFNDLHKLAGLEAVRQSFAEGVNLVLNPDNSQDQAIIDELAEWHERIVKANDSRPEPENLENPMNPENKDNIQTTSSNTTNSIEYEGRTQTVNETVYRESDFKHYELHDVTTDIMYLRKTPEEIQQDLDKEGTLKFYEGITHDGQRVTFRKTEQGWEAPLKDEPAQETNKKAQSSSRSEPEFTDPKVERPSETEPNARKVVLDLQYRIPDNIKTRYHSVGGKFYSVSDHKTVLFEDQGKQLKTALSDPQTVKDMLEVVKAKGWDSIKLSGSKDFRQAMFIEAAAQGIRTSGYNPTAADLQRVEALRERYAQNGITPEMVREQERRQPEVEKEQPRQEPHKQTEQGNSQSETGKPTQEQEQLKPEVEREERIHTQPDAAMLSAADRLKAQSTLPSDRTINASPRADTDIDVPVHSIGREEVPAEVVHQTDDMKAAALNTGFVAAKDHYMQKAQKLSKPNQKKLAMYERGVMDSIRGLEGDVRTKALRNYYEHTAQNMHGTKLKLPDPIQIPSPTQEQQQTAKGREQYSPERGQDPEITR
ncbi:PriCT-2 domain-containing protein [Neisseria perflava]|uniref:LPD7 domain-containing protein n=1 Tax=Neisseria perflava TaxID=33053 RepID=UPI00201A2676|nr:LPD7 domain-containing protein [Neisseria perflava]MCL5079592.1 PriCT-2 domain-containing protein [Neisseria perflava]